MVDLNTSDHKSERSGKSHIAAKFQYALTADFVPPIGVFWDIENCQVPKGRSATFLVQVVRERFFKGHREAEFMCVCDISKERKEIISELNDAQVTVVHIIATSKNAADDKLKQCMRRFVDIHGCPSTVVLITSDVNFSTDLSDFRYRRKIRIILIHGDHAPEPLLACADEHFRFEELTAALPYRSPAKGQSTQRSCELLVTDIPTNRDVRQIQNRLRRLSDNCGGKVVTIQGSTAIIRFSNPEVALRARKRMDKEDVFGSKISVHSGRSQEAREGSPLMQHLSRSRQSSTCGGSSRESSPILAELNGICQYHRSISDTGISQDSCFVIPPPPPDLIRRDITSQFEHTHLPSPEIKGNCDTKEPSFELKSIISHIASHQSNHQSHRSRNNSPVLQDKPKPFQRNVGRVSPFLMANSNSGPTMSASQCHSSRFQLFPTDSQSAGYGFTLPLRLPSATSNVAFSPIHRPNYLSPSPPVAPLYTWNAASLAPKEPFRLPSTGKTSPLPPPAPFSGTTSPVELLVTNLDQNIEANEMKKTLLAAFREHVMVLHVSILLQPDGTLKAIIKVPSIQDAQLAISQLHRRKIGFKRILISYTSNDRVPPLHILKAEVTTLLNDVPDNKMPLFKFRELFENRYHRSIGTCDLYKLKEVVHITEEKSGRMVCFHPNYRATPSPVNLENSELESLEKSYCEVHNARLPSAHGWAESDSLYPLPNVHISLKTLAPKVHTLLDSHQGAVPLNSFCACYESEFGTLPIIASSEQPESNPGVSIEHLIACIPGVQITKSALGIKKVQWLQNKDVQPLVRFVSGNRCISPALVGQVSLFSREMVDLLKNQPHCSIPFHKFIPLYHHHFGRQCRVSDYGYTKLVDLLEAIPHIVQILGYGTDRTLTLSHRSQMKRFASDLLRILKSRASKLLSLSEFPAAYEQCLGKPLDISHYGICILDDIFGELSENIVVVSHSDGETFVSIPKREQTSEEMERTKEFSREVIEILSYAPTCSMLFNKFVPAFHHHFGKQCKVADFGFSKLIELFEAIPDVLEILGSGEEKVIRLTGKEQLRVLGDRMVALVCAEGGSKKFVPLENIKDAYLKLHGHTLHLLEFGLQSFQQMEESLKNYIKLQEREKVLGLALVDQGSLQKMSLQLRCLLMEHPQGQMATSALRQLYTQRYDASLDLGILSHCFQDLIKVENEVVQLTPLQLLCRNLIQLLQENQGQMPLTNVEPSFLSRFGVPCQPAFYGFQTFASLLNSAQEYFLLKGKKRKILTFNPSNTCIPTLSTSHSSQVPQQEKSADKSISVRRPELELMIRASPFDLMSQPVPSSVPSPELDPEPQPLKDRDLMGFESPMPISNDIITGPSLSDRQNGRPNLLPFSSMYLSSGNMQASDFRMFMPQQQQQPFHFMHPPAAWLSPTAQGSTTSTHLLASDSNSRENLSLESLNSSGMSSAQDTPTRRSKRNRIAAHFQIH